MCSFQEVSIFSCTCCIFAKIPTNPDKLKAVQDWSNPYSLVFWALAVIVYPKDEDLIILNTDASQNSIGELLSKI